MAYGQIVGETQIIIIIYLPRRAVRNSSWEGAVARICCGRALTPEAAGGKGVWERNPQRLAILQFFNKNNAFLGIFRFKFLL